MSKLPPCLLIFFLVLGVSQQAPGKTGAPSHQFTVDALPFKKQEKEKFQLNIVQPYSFDLKTIQKCMASLAYQEKGFSWSDKKRAFSNSMIKRLSPMIQEQFTKAGKHQRVVYKISNPSGKTWLKGDTFLTREGMHWRLTILKYSKRPVDDFSIMGETWKLVPLKGQTFKQKKRFKNLIQDITNWVVFTGIRPQKSRIRELPLPPKTSEQKEVPTAMGTEIKKRLKILEELKKEGLINKEEYQIKRREILESF